MSAGNQQLAGAKGKRKLPWNDAMVLELVKSVKVKKAHTASKQYVTQRWKEVNTHFFEQPLMLPYKAEFYEEDDARKIREKFDRTRTVAKASMQEASNKSKQSGDLPELLQLMIEIETNKVIIKAEVNNVSNK